MRQAGFIFFSAFALVGCLRLPAPPDPASFEKVESLGAYTKYQTNRQNSDKKNLILIIADSYIQKRFQSLIDRQYSPDTDSHYSLEDLVWWMYAPDLVASYNVILRLLPEHESSQNLLWALSYMEQQSEPYDLVLLTHGFPNHLSTGQGYFFSWKEIDQLKHRLPNLNLIFMQGCYSDTLAPDWMRTGAKAVLSYSGMNRNFFYYGIFLKYYSKSARADQADAATRRNLRSELSSNNLYRAVIQAMGITVDEYIASIENPVLAEGK